MAWYRVLVRGDNFWLEMDGELKQLGFYTTRHVEAFDEEEAEHAACERVRTTADLRAMVRNDRRDPPVMVVEELEEIDRDDVPEIEPGFVFFEDE